MEIGVGKGTAIALLLALLTAGVSTVFFVPLCVWLIIFFVIILPVHTEYPQTRK